MIQQLVDLVNYNHYNITITDLVLVISSKFSNIEIFVIPALLTRWSTGRSKQVYGRLTKTDYWFNIETIYLKRTFIKNILSTLIDHINMLFFVRNSIYKKAGFDREGKVWLNYICQNGRWSHLRFVYNHQVWRHQHERWQHWGIQLHVQSLPLPLDGSSLGQSEPDMHLYLRTHTPIADDKNNNK